LQSGLISPEQLAYKYKNEIHANEIVLLAYYIAAINIEAVYHDIVGGDYQPFEGICLTDTFQLHEKEDLVSHVMEDNHARRKKQKALDIRVIIGNPPYSAGQNSANDNNANVAYPKLDDSIRSTYAAHSTATNKNALYDSYIRAIRWASDRVGDSGVIGFVSNAGFIDANTADGLRKCLADDFSSIYIFHLRGNARTSGELRRKEKDNVFGQGTRTPIAISILIKNPNATEHGKIYLHDIGDYLSQEEKLTKISELKSLNGISQAKSWLPITPDLHHDWVGQRDDSFSDFISLGDKKDKDSVTVFENYSRGAETGRDAWCYNCSKNQLTKNILSMIDFYNQEVKRYKAECNGIAKTNWPNLDNFVSNDPAKISWTSSLKTDAQKHLEHSFFKENMTNGLYRQYSKQWSYFGNQFTHRVGQMPHIFPDATADNRVISVTGRGATKDFCALITNTLPDLEMISKGQCFPLKLYEKNLDQDGLIATDNLQGDMFSNPRPNESANNDAEYTVKGGIADAGLAHFQSAYPTETITKEDVFYYIYGLLHSEDYKSRYADNLSKELPRIPCVNKAADFWAFSKAGRDLAELHINYETVTPYPVTINCGTYDFDSLSDADFYVTQMKFIKKGEKATVVYNYKITLTNIPLEAYDYVVNGKPALEWVMERQAVTTHKDSGIKNDANDWAIETIGNARYPLELFQRVITVSLETMKIVNALPLLDIIIGLHHK
ncbi:MAG: hypothetical protein RIR39_1141, partial [Pseudomonadota bacterium]